VNNLRETLSKGVVVRLVLSGAVLAALPVTGLSQAREPLDVGGKFRFHAEATYEPLSIVGIAAYAGVLQEADAPGLDSTLHQDPRYMRSRDSGFWRRTGHAIRETILTHTDSGGETFSTWRIGSDYGSAFLSNMWYPDRLNTVRLGFLQGSVTLGFGLVSNLGSELLPDIKRKVLHRK
jgi:hypothetical protein